MPHGLTPLGRQLSLVLRNFHHPRPSFVSITLSECRTAGHDRHSPRRCSTASSLESRKATVSRRTIRQKADSNIHSENGGAISKKTRNRRRKWQHPITTALNTAGNEAVLPKPPPTTARDLSHGNPGERREVDAKNAKRHANDWVAHPDSVLTISLTSIVARYIMHAGTSATDRQVAASYFKLTNEEEELLRANDCSLQDIEAWSSILQDADPLKAATRLVETSRAHGDIKPSDAILRYLLRRRYLGSSAIRVLLNHAWHSSSFSRSASSLSNTSMITFVRMLRHAKEVLPEAIESITALLLQSLPRPDMENEEGLNRKQLALLTHRTNKVLSLLSFPASESPFKNNVHQQEALLGVLKYMADFQPPLALNREGYRAVIRLQLAQGKTSSEKQWAELKALSWPPWKEERTAMDASIGLDYGTTRAGHTLFRMAEAGYGPRAWERAAKLYAGWDPDGTPTIQTRTLFVKPSAAFQGRDRESLPWAARIETTRTIQEAWACYLAYEDMKLPPSEDVNLAILRKLHQEERRHWAMADGETVSSTNLYATRHVYPGDAREIAPLPPSTHLETYTRSQPPSMDDFYRNLSERGVQLQDRCLAFLVANASMLRHSVEYLRSASDRHPAILDLLGWRHDHSLDTLPDKLFHAFIAALCKHMHARPPSRWITTRHTTRSDQDQALDREHNQADTFLRANPVHSLVHATKLVSSRPTFHPPSFHTLLQGLAKYHSQLAPSHKPALALVQPIRTQSQAQDANQSPTISQSSLTQPYNPNFPHIVNFRLAQQTLHAARNLHGDIDEAMLRPFCIVVENTTLACWRILLSDPDPPSSERAKQIPTDPAVEVAKKTLHSCRRLWEVARGVLGIGMTDDEHVDPDHRDEQAPLLQPPSPALLHALIRALGLSAQWPEILILVRWMARHEDSLRQRRQVKEAFNGQRLQRRAIVAVRAMGERAFLPQEVGGVPDEIGEHGEEDGSAENSTTASASEPARVGTLEELRSPAPAWVLRDLRSVVEGVEEWGGWPRDDECAVYCGQASNWKFEGLW
ncbi:hypothetical protein MBLNU230_g7752t1 [Neophaeotheca triangularis]